MNNAKFAILTATIPPNKEGVKEDSWIRFLSKIPRNSDPTKGLEVTSVNLWQITLPAGLRSLCDIFREADEEGIAMRVLFLEEAPTWLEYPAHGPKSA